MCCSALLSPLLTARPAPIQAAVQAGVQAATARRGTQVQALRPVLQIPLGIIIIIMTGSRMGGGRGRQPGAHNGTGGDATFRSEHLSLLAIFIPELNDT